MVPNTLTPVFSTLARTHTTVAAAQCRTKSTSHHFDPVKPLEMSDVVRVLMERCEENVNSERVHTNKKFRLKRTHTNEILDQLVSRMGTTIAKLTSSLIADVVLKLDSYLFSP